METTHRTGVDDKGETAKKTLENPDKAPKYTTIGNGKDKDGKTIPAKGVSFDSLVGGIISSGSGRKGEVAQEIVGDPIKGTPVKYPTNPNPQVVPNPNPNPDVKPDPNPDPNPNPNPNPNPSDIEPDLEEIDPSQVKTPQLLKKFPFCIPWDIVDLVTAVSAEKKAPKFTLPFKLNSKQSSKVRIDEKVVIDFSKYENLAVICRWFFRLIFIAGLVVLTRYIIKG